MVTVQEIEARQKELLIEEQKARDVESERIPERRYGFGVTPQDQRVALERKSQATQFISEVQQRKQELESAKQELLAQERAQAEAKEYQSEYQKGYEKGVEGVSPGYKPSRALLEGYRVGRNALEGYYAKSERKNKAQSSEVQELEGGQFMYQGRLFDASGNEIFLKSGTGLSPKQAEIRQKLINSGFVKEQSTATGLGVSPLPEIYTTDNLIKKKQLKVEERQYVYLPLEEVEKSYKKGEQPFEVKYQEYIGEGGILKKDLPYAEPRERVNIQEVINKSLARDYPKKEDVYVEFGFGLGQIYSKIKERFTDKPEEKMVEKSGINPFLTSDYKGDAVLNATYEQATNPRYGDFKWYSEEGKSTGQIISQRFKQVGIGVGQKALFLTEESINFYLKLVPKQGTTVDGKPVVAKLNIREAYKNTLVGQKLEEFRNIPISNTASVLSGTAVYGSVIASTVVGLTPGLVSAVRTSYVLAKAGKFSTSLAPLGEFTIETLRPLNFLNFKNPTPALEVLQKGINLRKVNPNSIAKEFQTYAILDGKTVRVANYRRIGEIAPPKFKLDKDFINQGGVIGESRFSGFKEPRYYRIEPLGNRVINDNPYFGLEFREGSRTVRIGRIAGNSEDFNANLDVGKLNPAERYALIKYVERQIGRPISLSSGTRDKFITLKYEGEPLVKRFFKGETTHLGYYSQGTAEINLAKELRGETLKNVFLHERAHYKRYKSGINPEELINKKELSSDQFRSIEAKLYSRGYRPEKVSEEIIAFGSQPNNELGIKEDSILRMKINEALERIGATELSNKDINAMIQGGMKIKERLPLNFFKVKEGEMFQKGVVISQKSLKINLDTRVPKEYGVPGKKLSVQSYVSRTKPLLETDKIDVFTSTTTFKDITNPNYRLSGKTPKIDSEIVVLKEPIIISEEPSQLLIPSGKRSTGYQELVNLALPKTTPVAKPIIKAPNVKVQTTAQDLTPTTSRYYGQGIYERTETQIVGRTAKGVVGIDFTSNAPMQQEFSTPKVFTGVRPVEVSRGASREVSKEVTRELNKEITKEITRELTKGITKEVTRQTNKQVSRQVNKQINKQVTKQGIPTVIPASPPTTPTTIKFPTITLPEGESEGESSPSYKPFVIKGGKKVFLKSIGVPKGIALRGAETEALTTLRATFGAEPTGAYTTQRDIKFVPQSAVFRSYRLVKGKKVPLDNTFIQRREKRLSSPGEISEIQNSRRKR